MTPPPDAPHLGLVVEGRGEVQAVPLLLRRRLSGRGVYRDLVGRPVSCNGRENALKPKGIEGKVAVAAVRPGCRCVLVLLDGEGDPVCELGPELLRRSRDVAAGKEVVVCLADRKYEDWLVASAESLQVPGLTYRPDRDSVSVLKEALLPSKYIKPSWQPRLSHDLDFELASGRNPSLARFLAKFDTLIDRHFGEGTSAEWDDGRDGRTLRG
jgi:hypothetical protein